MVRRAGDGDRAPHRRPGLAAGATVIAGAFVEGKGLASQTASWALLAVVVLRGRGLVHGGGGASLLGAGQIAAAPALVGRVAAGPARGLAGAATGDIATLATRGVDALDGYYSRYLPQLVLAVIVPLTVLAVVSSRDWMSAAIILVTLPLIPVFMALIGMATRHHTDRQLRTLQSSVRPLPRRGRRNPTLKVFGRSKAQVRTIRGSPTATATRRWQRCGSRSSRRSCSNCSPAWP